MATMDPEIKAAVDKYKLPAEACWLHKQSGKYILTHWACEHIAITDKITFETPFIVSADPEKKIAVICVTGRLGERSEWSFGEAAPYNTGQSYPFAMAEKRAKDRVVLKLVGLSGKFYSEEESDAFKETTAAKEPDHGEAQGPLTKTVLKEKLRQFCADLPCCETEDELAGILRGYDSVLKQCERDLSGWWNTKPDGDSIGIKDRIGQRRAYIAKRSQNPLHAA